MVDRWVACLRSFGGPFFVGDRAWEATCDPAIGGAPKVTTAEPSHRKPRSNAQAHPSRSRAITVPHTSTHPGSFCARARPPPTGTGSASPAARVTVGVPSERGCALTLALFGKKVRAYSLRVIPRDLAPVPTVQSDSFRNSSARSTDLFGSPIPKSRLHTQPIAQMVLCNTLKLRPCTRSDRAQLRTHQLL